MKLIYIINARMPTEKAYGYQIGKMCEEFANAGIEVELWIPTRKNNIKEDVFSFYKLKKNFEVKKIKSFDFLRFTKYLGRFSYYFQIFEFFVRLLFRDINKYCIIYTRNPELVWLFKLRGYRVGYECHDWFNKNKKLSLFFLRKCDYIITTNNFIRKEFINHGFGRKKVLTSPNGIDLKKFDIGIDKERALKIIDIDEGMRRLIFGKKILLYTGSFRTMGVDKGIKEILEALKFINNDNLVFVAVGGSKGDIEYYKRLSKELKIGNQAFFFSRQTQDKLALWQKAADILLMPFPAKAHYQYFMTPLKMFEYMASGKPIIASDLPSIREILNEKNCLFCRPGDSKDLAKKIKYVLSNISFFRKVAIHARRDVENYTWEKRAKKILEFANGKFIF
jgi:glycosyltransferase involved in cell wall biosynthesis